MSLRFLLIITAIFSLAAQPPARPPQFVSPEVGADRTITFRLYAPNATEVRVSAGDIPGTGPGKAMTKGENGVWEATLGPVVPGAYRYNFNVGGLAVMDPRNPMVSESNNNAWSMVVVPGSELFDTRDVPHGAIAAVTYHSKALGRFRRMHIYTPPGYELGKNKYPVFYLLHGAGDSDHSWGSVGRTGFILDNLIAAKKAKPMIVVMPAGHTSRDGFRATGPGDDFSKEVLGDIMPYVESNYRTVNTRAGRAIAGLSMGGMQTLNIAVPNLEKFAYVGVFSSGLIQVFGGARPGAPGADAQGVEERLAAWEKESAAGLKPEARKGLKLFWLGIGKDDFLLDIHKKTVALLQKHGFEPVVRETEGAHTWLKWRDYLSELAPQLFQ
jgi:enterochelin esterase family protein